MSPSVLSEASLVDAFLAASGHEAADRIVLREFGTLAGIPDVVIVETAQQGVDLGTELQAARAVTNGHANVMSCLSRRRPHTLGYIVSRSGLGPNYVRRIISDLRQLGLVDECETGSVTLAASYEPPRVRFTALEFKLTDWRRALSQAIRHQSFARRALVVMPVELEEALRRAANTFRGHGVGSAVFDPVARRLSFVVRPKSRRSLSQRAFLDAVGRAASGMSNQQRPEAG